MADVIIRVSTDDQTNFDGIQRELNETASTAERAFRRIEQETNDLRRESLRLREEYNRIGREIVENNRIAASGDRATRTRIQQSNRQLRVQQSLVRTEQQRASLTLANLTQERRELQQVVRATNNLATAKGRAETAGRRFGGVIGTIAENFLTWGGGIQAITQHLGMFVTGSIQAAATLEGFERGLRLVEGTNAPQRLQELIEVANLPGLNLDSLINYSNRLRAVGLTADEADVILRATGQTIVAFGGTADTASQAVEQITQALQTNTVALGDFRPLAQRVPGLYNAIAETHGVEASLDGFRVAVDRAGGSVKDALIPVLLTLEAQFGNTPADSYIVSLDGLQNSFFLLQAEIGERFLPVIAEGARALSTFFDAIRENNLGTLPEPIQRIIEGAQALWEQFQRIAGIIGNAVGPELSALGDALGPLLGSILELVSAVGTALEPVFQLWAAQARIIIALVVRLAEDLTSVIGAVTDFVDWITFWNDEEKALNETTRNVTASVQDLTTATTSATEANQASTTSVDALVAATNQASAAAQQRAESTRAATAAEQGATTAGQSQATQLATTQAALLQVNQRLDEKRAMLDRLSGTITSTAHPAYVQLENQVSTLETSSATLTEQVNTLSASILGVEAPAMAADGATRVFSQTLDETDGVLARVDTRFLSFRERGMALTAAIRELPPEITRVRTELQGVSPFAAQITQRFRDMELSLVDTSVDATIFNQIFREMQTVLTSTAADQAIATAEFRLVNPVISEAVGSLRGYVANLDTTNLSTQDLNEITRQARVRLTDYSRQVLTTEGVLGNFGDRVDETRDEVVGLERPTINVTSAMNAFSHAISDTQQEASDAATNLDILDAAMDDVDRRAEEAANSVTSLDLAFEELSMRAPNFLAGTLDLLAAMNDEFAGIASAVGDLVGAAASGDPIGFLSAIPGLVDELNALVTDENLTTSARAGRAFDVADQIRDSDLSGRQQNELIGTLNAYIEELLVRSILSTPEALSPALIAQHEAFAQTRGLSFNFAEARSRLGLDDTGFQTPFDLPEIDLEPFREALRPRESRVGGRGVGGRRVRPAPRGGYTSPIETTGSGLGRPADEDPDFTNPLEDEGSGLGRPENAGSGQGRPNIAVRLSEAIVEAVVEPIADAVDEFTEGVTTAVETVQDTQDTRQAARDDQVDTRQMVRDDQVDTRQVAREERADTQQQARAEQADIQQQARDDREDARQQARHELDDAHLQMAQDIINQNIEARQAIQDEGVEARETTQDIGVEARETTQDAGVETREATQDTRLEAREAIQNTELEEREAKQRTELEAREALQRAELEEREALQNTRLHARETTQDTRLTEREAIQAIELEEREARQRAELEAREATQDTNLETRERLQAIELEERETKQRAELDARETTRDTKLAERERLQAVELTERETKQRAELDAREATQRAELIARETTQDAREGNRQAVQDTRQSLRLRGNDLYETILQRRELIHVMGLERLQLEALQERLDLQEIHLTSLWDNIARRFTNELRSIEALRVGTLSAAMRADQAAIAANEAAMRADQAAIAAAQGIIPDSGGGITGDGTGSNTETIIVNSVIELDGEMVGSNTEVVKAASARQSQLQAQGVVGQ